MQEEGAWCKWLVSAHEKTRVFLQNTALQPDKVIAYNISGFNGVADHLHTVSMWLLFHWKGMVGIK